MKEDKCPIPAQFQLPWAGQIKKACIYHANALCKISEAIASPIHAETYSGTEPCFGANDLAEMGVDLS